MKTFYLFVFSFLFSIACFSQGSWTELKTVDCNQPASEIPIKRYDATGFGVGNKVFYSSGLDSPGGIAPYTFLNDLYEFDLSTNLWVQKSSYPGLGRRYAIGFDFNNFGFLMLGENDSIDMNDCWKYDYTLNSWSQLNDFPGNSRVAAFTFLLNNKFYIGGGVTISGFVNDFWEYGSKSLISALSAKVILASIARYCTRTCAPKSVTCAPPPLPPPTDVATIVCLKFLFIVFTKSQARL